VTSTAFAGLSRAAGTITLRAYLLDASAFRAGADCIRGSAPASRLSENLQRVHTVYSGQGEIERDVAFKLYRLSISNDWLETPLANGSNGGRG
jgi:hypothetical protein